MNANAKRLSSKTTGKSHLSLVKPEKSLIEMTNEELILACQAQRKDAIDVLLKRHHSTLIAMVRVRFPELSDTSDIVQEAQIRMWKSIDQLRTPGAFKGWLGRIVTNLCYDELRRKVRNQDVISLDEPIESEDGTTKMERLIADHTTQPDTTLQRKELVTALTETLDRIPQEFRQSVLLREVDGLSYEEIAVLMKVELGTVKSRISRARTKMQAQMASFLNEAA